MLPGLRFLLATIVLSTSLLIFAVGAAALLRVAHSEFTGLASNPSPAEPVFSRKDSGPALAMLQVDAPSTENQVPDPQSTEGMQLAFPELEPSEIAPDSKPESFGRDGERMAALEEAGPEEIPPAPMEPVANAATTAGTLQSEAASAVAEMQVAATDESGSTAPAPATAEPRAAGMPANDTPRVAETGVATPGGPPAEVARPVKITARISPNKRAVAIAATKPSPKKRTVMRRKIPPRPQQLARPVQPQPPPFAAPFGSWDNGWPARPRAGKTQASRRASVFQAF